MVEPIAIIIGGGALAYALLTKKPEPIPEPEEIRARGQQVVERVAPDEVEECVKIRRRQYPEFYKAPPEFLVFKEKLDAIQLQYKGIARPGVTPSQVRIFEEYAGKLRALQDASKSAIDKNGAAMREAYKMAGDATSNEAQSYISKGYSIKRVFVKERFQLLYACPPGWSRNERT